MVLYELLPVSKWR